MARVLVADDDEDIRDLIGVSLTHECAFARDGAEAIDALSRQRIDLVVLDVMMPHVDGLEVLRRIRTSPDHAHLPVVLLTAKVSEDDHLRGYQSGADAYLTKPFDIDELQSQVDRLLTIAPEVRAKSREDETAKASLLRLIERRFDV